MENPGHTFTWKIENFPRNACSEGEYLKSPSFKVKIRGFDTAWCLLIYPNEEFQIIDCFQQKNVNTSAEEVKVVFALSFDTAKVNIESSRRIDYFKPPEEPSLPEERDKHWLLLKQFKLLNSSLSFPDDSFTVRLHMWRYSSEKTPVFNYFALTHIEISKFTFTKIISNFSSLSMERKVRFSLIPYPAIKILLYVREKSEYLSVEIQHNETAIRRIRLNCMVSALSHNGIPYERQDNFLYPEQNDAKWSFPDFILIKDFSSADETSLCFKFIVNTGNMKSEICITECVPMTIDDEIGKQTQDFHLFIREYQNRFLGGMLPDTEIRSNNKLFFVHKIILTRNSSFFSKKFGDIMNPNVIQLERIEDIDLETLSKLLQFMYTKGLEDLNEATAINLISVADKYQVYNLKEKCAFKLIELISAQNACVLLQLAHSHNLESLKSYVQEFICFHYRDIFATNEWEQLTRQHVELACEIFEKLSLMSKKN